MREGEEDGEEKDESILSPLLSHFPYVISSVYLNVFVNITFVRNSPEHLTRATGYSSAGREGGRGEYDSSVGVPNG